MRPNLKQSHYEKSRGSFVQKARGRRCSQLLHSQQSIFDIKCSPRDFLNNFKVSLVNLQVKQINNNDPKNLGIRVIAIILPNL